MSVEEHEAVIGRWMEAWNAQDLDAGDRPSSPDFVRHDASLPEVLGPAAQRDFLRGVFRAFPDIHVKPQHLITEGNLAAAHLVVTGTRRDDFLGIPATGRKMAIRAGTAPSGPRRLVQAEHPPARGRRGYAVVRWRGAARRRRHTVAGTGSSLVPCQVTFANAVPGAWTGRCSRPSRLGTTAAFA